MHHCLSLLKSLGLSSIGLAALRLAHVIDLVLLGLEIFLEVALDVLLQSFIARYVRVPREGVCDEL